MITNILGIIACVLCYVALDLVELNARKKG